MRRERGHINAMRVYVVVARSAGTRPRMAGSVCFYYFFHIHFQVVRLVDSLRGMIVMGIIWYLLVLLMCFLTLGCEEVVDMHTPTHGTSPTIEGLFDSAGYYLKVCELPDSTLHYLELLRPLCGNAHELTERYNGLLMDLAWLTRNYEDVLTIAAPTIFHASLHGESITGQDPLVINMSAHALRKLGDTTSAIKLYEFLASTDLLAMRRGARANLLTLYSMSNAHQRAIEVAESIESIERMNPADISAHLNRDYYWARSLAALGKTNKAIEHLKAIFQYLAQPRPNYNTSELRVRLTTARGIRNDLMHLRVPHLLRETLRGALDRSLELDSTVLAQKFGRTEAAQGITSVTIPEHLFLAPKKLSSFIRASALQNLSITATALDSREVRWVSTLHGLYVSVGQHLVRVPSSHHPRIVRPIRTLDISGDTVYLKHYNAEVSATPISAIISNHTEDQRCTSIYTVRPLPSDVPLVDATAKLTLNDSTTIIGTSAGIRLHVRNHHHSVTLQESLHDTVVSLYRRRDTIIVSSHALGTRAILMADAEAGRRKFFRYDAQLMFHKLMFGEVVSDVVMKHLHGTYTSSSRPVVDELYPSTILRMLLNQRDDAVIVGTRGIMIASKNDNKAQFLQWPDSIGRLFDGGFYTSMSNDSTIDVTLKDQIITVDLNRLLHRKPPQFLTACLADQDQTLWIGWLGTRYASVSCSDSITVAVGTSSVLSAYRPMISITGGSSNDTVRTAPDGLYHLRVPNLRSHPLTFTSPGLIQSATLLIEPDLHPLMYQDALIALVILASGGLGYSTVYTWRRVANRHKANLEQHHDSITRDLHDTLGADLARLSALLNANEAQHSRAIVSAALAANRKFRSLLWIWRSDSIRVGDFLGELREYTAACFADADIDLTNNQMAIEGDHYVAADVAKNVLIILNESITNVIRHASASRAALDIQRDASSIRIELSDNGIGFDIDHHTRRSGISNIAKRASEHSFHAHVTSAPKQGTSVVVSFRVHSS